MKKIIGLLSALFISFGLTAFAATNPTKIDTQALTLQGGTILSYLNGNTNTDNGKSCYDFSTEPDTSFNCLVKALKATGLDQTLSGTGTYTLFAPTDAAFKDLATTMGQSAFDALFMDSAKLKDILTYHVLPVQKTLSDLYTEASAGMLEVKTVQGANLQVNFVPADSADPVTTVTLGMDPNNTSDPQVVQEAVQTDNGVVVAINHVLSLPSAKDTN